MLACSTPALPGVALRLVLAAQLDDLAQRGNVEKSLASASMPRIPSANSARSLSLLRAYARRTKKANANAANVIGTLLKGVF
jgi:hypothetical protein